MEYAKRVAVRGAQSFAVAAACGIALTCAPLPASAAVVLSVASAIHAVSRVRAAREAWQEDPEKIEQQA
eukprot:6352539-Amphidinium_carterae.1